MPTTPFGIQLADIDSFAHLRATICQLLSYQLSYICHLSPTPTIQKLFLSYILVGDFTIITPISFANETLKTVRIWQMKLLLINCRRRWVI